MLGSIEYPRMIQTSLAPLAICQWNQQPIYILYINLCFWKPDALSGKRNVTMCKTAKHSEVQLLHFCPASLSSGSVTW